MQGGRVRFGWVGVLLAIATLTSVGATPADHTTNGSGHIDRPLELLAQQHAGSTVRVMVQARGGGSAERAVLHASGNVRKQLPQIGGVAAEVRTDQVAALVREPGVVRIMLDPQMRSVAS